MENLRIEWRFDPSYSAETRSLLERELVYLALLHVDDNYRHIAHELKAIADSDHHTSRSVGEAFATVDGAPLCTMNYLEIQRSEGPRPRINRAIFCAGRADYIAELARRIN
jgi:hypothetical protein